MQATPNFISNKFKFRNYISFKKNAQSKYMCNISIGVRVHRCYPVEGQLTFIERICVLCSEFSSVEFVCLFYMFLFLLQKMVTKGEEEENRLYNKVRETEYARQNQEQAVKRVQTKFQQTRSKNSQDMKKQLTEVIKVEKEYEQKIVREQALLDKVSIHHRYLCRKRRVCNAIMYTLLVCNMYAILELQVKYIK